MAILGSEITLELCTESVQQYGIHYKQWLKARTMTDHSVCTVAQNLPVTP
jgi:hypothetical protein